MEQLGRSREKAPSDSVESKKLPENVVVVDRPEARFRILYEFHQNRREHTPEEVDGVDAIAVEATGPLTEEWMVPAMGMDPNYALPGQGHNWNQQEDKFIWKIIEQKTPLYLFDIHDYGDFSKIMEITDRTRDAESLIGLAAQVYIIAQGVSSLWKRAPNRRDFLKMGAAAPFAAKGFLANVRMTTPEDEFVNRQYTPSERAVIRAKELLNPELEGVQLTLRNALWAYKLRTTIADDERERVGRKPEIAAIVGAAHTGLENMLAKKPEELLENISTTMAAIKKISQIFGAPIPHMDISTVARYEFDKEMNKWVLRHHQNSPALSEIMKEYVS